MTGITLTFMGAVGTVTGSKYLLEFKGTRILVDCGLFQGFKQMRLRNWARLPVDPKSIETVVLTHAHLDHSGYLPLLVRNGFSRSVLCTEATYDLCEVLLTDSGFLQEREAELANRYGYSKHHPAFPLYTEQDARAALTHFTPAPFNSVQPAVGEFEIMFHRAGHILGAAIVQLTAGGTTVTFSGDLGRPGSVTMPDPTAIRTTDFLVVESTYGDRQHDPSNPDDVLTDIIKRTVGRGGSVLIPSFAVGRTQTILYHLHRIREAGRIPNVPVFLDSPMAIDASDIFCNHPGDHRLTAHEARAACGVAHYVRSVEESKALVEDPMPKVVISASGMATGGRVLHYLKQFAPNHKNTILFAGFQAGGTRGAAITEGAEKVKIHGAYVPIRAEVDNLQMLSAHADSGEIMEWLKNFDRPPKRTFVTHGEPAAADALRHRIEEELGWPCTVPEYLETVKLS